MLIPRFHSLIRRVVRGHSTPVTVHWVEYDGAGTTDPTTGRNLGTRRAMSLATSGVFLVITAESKAPRFTSMEVGEAILDLDAADLDLPAKGELIFEVAGLKYGQKDTQGVPPTMQDALLSGEPTVRTFYLTPLR